MLSKSSKLHEKLSNLKFLESIWCFAGKGCFVLSAANSRQMATEAALALFLYIHKSKPMLIFRYIT